MNKWHDKAIQLTSKCALVREKIAAAIDIILCGIGEMLIARYELMYEVADALFSYNGEKGYRFPWDKTDDE